MKDIKKDVEFVFERNLQRNKLFTTSDGNIFLHEGEAKNHAKTLKNKEIETWSKDKKVVENPTETDLTGTEPVKPAKDKAPKS